VKYLFKALILKYFIIILNELKKDMPISGKTEREVCALPL
jgi:hypothetical protein